MGSSSTDCSTFAKVIGSSSLSVTSCSCGSLSNELLRLYGSYWWSLFPNCFEQKHLQCSFSQTELCCCIRFRKSLTKILFLCVRSRTRNGTLATFVMKSAEFAFLRAGYLLYCYRGLRTLRREVHAEHDLVASLQRVRKT